MPMKREDVAKKVRKIKESKEDYEAAHSMEDHLYLTVLRVIASGADNAEELASEAIKASEIDYPRYCA